MVSNVLKFIIAIPLALIMLLIVAVNVKLDYKPAIEINSEDTIQSETLLQLRGLKQSLDEHADSKMQAIYPEGYVFLNSIYALSWINFLGRQDHMAYQGEARLEIERAWTNINSDTALASFDGELSLPYGAFYNGWSSYVLAKKLQRERLEERNAHQITIFKSQCQRIADAVERSVYPSSYHGASWPADVVLCLAVLSLHDQLFEPLYEQIIARWLTQAKLKLDPLGMLPHSVDPSTGNPVENARGSSMALMLLFLSEIDSSFAAEQFRLFRANFIDTRLGLCGIREYPRGTFGIGDVDSGPVVFGFGGAATIVGAQTLAVYGEYELSCRVRGGIEALAFPINSEKRKQFFFGWLPMADAFITWGDSTISANWRTISFFKFRIYSLMIFVLSAVLFWRLFRNISKTQSEPITDVKTKT